MVKSKVCVTGLLCNSGLKMRLSVLDLSCWCLRLPLGAMFSGKSLPHPPGGAGPRPLEGLCTSDDLQWSPVFSAADLGNKFSSTNFSLAVFLFAQIGMVRGGSQDVVHASAPN